MNGSSTVRRVARWVGAAALAAGVAVGAAGRPAAAETHEGSAARELAEKYAPVVMTVAQPERCSTDGEAFTPMAVDAVLGNPQIALRQVGTGDPVVTWGPTAADLYGLGDGFYLDFPGDALAPGCTYEKDFHRYTADLEPTVYAHVVTQDDHPDRLVVEYWFYWYFNDWNNTHESDWEGIQLVFPVGTPQEALATDPIEVGYAQHEGGERAEWGASKLELVGVRPVVYPSRGSHASYYQAALHLGRSASEGFGCDTTQGPSTRVDPAIVLLPGAASGPDDEFAWLGYDGHWGELNGGPYNGPTGPAVKGRWAEPINWQENLSNVSAELPTAGSRSGGVVHRFCDVVEWGSNQVMSLARSPMRMLVSLAVLAAVAVYLVRRTVWDATTPVPIVTRRRNGQILRTTFGMFASAPGTFAGIALAAIPVAVVCSLLASLLRHLPVFGALLDSSDRGGLMQLFLVLVAGAVASAATFTFVGAAVAAAMDGASTGRRVSAADAIARVRPRVGTLAASFAVAALAVVVLGSFVILAPVAVYLLVRYQFIAQVVMLEGEPRPLRVLARSAAVSRGRWWHTAVALGLIGGLTKLVSALVGLLVLVVLQPPFWLLSMIIVAVDALLAPFAAICATYLYGDAIAEAAHEPGPPAEHEPAEAAPV